MIAPSFRPASRLRRSSTTTFALGGASSSDGIRGWIDPGRYVSGGFRVQILSTPWFRQDRMVVSPENVVFDSGTAPKGARTG